MSESCEKCAGDSSDTMCDDGEIWGPCESEYCYGACDYMGACDCECHKEPDAALEAAQEQG